MSETEGAADVKTAGAEDLTRLILEKKDLVYLDALENPNINDDHLKLILHDDAVPFNVVKAIHECDAFVSKYQVKVALVNNPRTPKVVALNLVKYLYWRDLVKVSHNIKLLAPVRYSAELCIKDRLYEITLGEKITLARMCTREIIKELRKETNEMIFRGLLTNPQLTEEDLTITITQPKTPAHIIAIIAQSEKWFSRYPVRMALIRCPKTPRHVGMAILPTLLQKDLRAVLNDANVPKILKHAALRVLANKRNIGM